VAELISAEKATTNSCCAPEAQATCCEPSAKAECCAHEEGCGCAAGTTGEQGRDLP
jgi:arsenite methyltransferase